MDQPGMIEPRPLPAITPLTEPFWSGTRRHELLVQRCRHCERAQFPPEISCTHCGADSEALEW